MRLATVLTAAFILSIALGCSSEDDNANTDGDAIDQDSTSVQDTSDEDSTNGFDPGPESDTSEFEAMWDGSVQRGEVLDTVYWYIPLNGVLIRYDYQGDGLEGATGNNCYTEGDLITLEPVGGDEFLLGTVATSIVRDDGKLTIRFNEPDSADLDQNGDVDEIPTFEWSLLAIMTPDELEICS